MAGLIAVIYGIAAYALSLVTILYAIGFVSNLVVPKSIDSGAADPLIESVLINTMLLGLFAVQHSVMARQGFKRWWTRFVPPSIERSTFVLFSSLALLLLYSQWRPIPEPIWTVQNPVIATALETISFFGWGLLFASTFMLSHFQLQTTRFDAASVTWSQIGRSRRPPCLRRGTLPALTKPEPQRVFA